MPYDRGVARSCINGRQGEVVDVKTEVFVRHREGRPDSGHPEGTEKHTIFILTLIKKEKNHQSFYDSGGFFVRRNINCLFFRRKFLFFIH